MAEGKRMENKIVFNADKVKISGPKVDGSCSITFDTGEYEQNNIAKLFKIPQQTTLEVTVYTNASNREMAYLKRAVEVRKKQLNGTTKKDN